MQQPSGPASNCAPCDALRSLLSSIRASSSSTMASPSSSTSAAAPPTAEFVPDTSNATQRSAPLTTQHRAQTDYDCLPCRLTGAAAFGGLAGYAWYQATRAPGALQLPLQRRVAIGVLGCCFASASVFRLLF